MKVQLDPVPAQSATHPIVTAPGEGSDVLGRVDFARAAIARDSCDLLGGIAVTDDEPRSALAQAAIEIGEALQHELRSRSRGMPAPQQRIVEAEEGDDPFTAIERGAQGGVVAKAQIAPHPDDRR
jgi:hypothetical protein